MVRRCGLLLWRSQEVGASLQYAMDWRPEGRLCSEISEPLAAPPPRAQVAPDWRRRGSPRRKARVRRQRGRRCRLRFALGCNKSGMRFGQGSVCEFVYEHARRQASRPRAARPSRLFANFRPPAEMLPFEIGALRVVGVKRALFAHCPLEWPVELCSPDSGGSCRNYPACVPGTDEIGKSTGTERT